MSLAAGLAGLGGLAIGTGTYVVSAATLLRLRRRQRGNREHGLLAVGLRS